MTKNYKILSAVFRGAWWIEPAAADSYMPLVAALLEGKPLLEVNEEAPAKPAAALMASKGGAAVYYETLDDIPEGSVSLTHFDGAIQKYDSCFSYGTQSLSRRLKAADDHPNVSAHILLMDSPGGTVDGTKDAADTVKNLKKPVIAFVDGMAASAAYWITSSASEVILSNDTSQVGSIGTMLSFADQRARYEAMGIKFHDIRATESYDKNETFYEARKGNYKPMQTEVLDPLNKIFQNAVKANRPGVDESTLHGKMYLAADAIKKGLADAIGDFDYAMSRAKILANGGDSPEANKPQKEDSQMFKSKFEKKLEAAAKGEEITAEQLAEINAALEEMGITGYSLAAVADAAADQVDTEKVEMQEELNRLTAELETAQTTLAVAVADRDKFKAQAEEYGAQPGAVHTSTQKPEGDALSADDVTGQSVIDNLPHNKALDGNPMFNHSNEKE